jgi:hypothetical protein
MNEKQLRLKDLYKEHMHECLPVRENAEEIRQYLGPFDSLADWNRDPQKANAKFFKIKEYEDFIDEEIILLIGRTGTGKTSILKKTEYDINNGSISFYKNVIILNLKDCIHNLARIIPSNSESYQENYDIEEYLKNYICVSVMIYLNNKFAKTGKLQAIRNYLSSLELNKPELSLDLIYSFLDEITLKSETIAGNAINALAHLGQRCRGDAFYMAQKEMMKILATEGNILVLIDSLEEYNTQNVETIRITKSLISVCFSFYNNVNSYNIYVKMALPSEVYTAIRDGLPAKMMGNLIYIEWSYSNLVQLIAIKLFFFSKEESSNHMFDNTKYNADMLYKDFQKAKEYLLEFLPEISSATLMLKFETLAYIIRHTQRKPRQLLMIFNSIIKQIYKRNNNKYFINNPDKIKDAIHIVQEEMLKDTLNMYNTTYSNILDYCSNVLSFQKYIFDEDKFSEMLKTTLSATSYNRVTIEDVRRIILESGIIGIVDSEVFVEKNHPSFQNEEIIKILKSTFEYQIKGRISKNKKNIYVIHPMCYEYYRNEIDLTAFVYPNEFDDEDDEISRIEL